MHSILLVYYYLILWFFPFLLAFSFSSSSSVWNSFFIERIICFYLQPNRIANTGVCSSPDRNTHTSVLTPCEYLFFYSSSLITIRYIKLSLLLSFENMYDCGTITFYFIGFVFCFYFIFVFVFQWLRDKIVTQTETFVCVCLFCFFKIRRALSYSMTIDQLSRKHHARNSGSEMIIPDMQFPNESRRVPSFFQYNSSHSQNRRSSTLDKTTCNIRSCLCTTLHTIWCRMENMKRGRRDRMRHWLIQVHIRVNVFIHEI